MFWNESGEQVCIATEESFFILKYKAAAVERARQTPDGITEDGIEEAFDVCSFKLIVLFIFFLKNVKFLLI